MQSERTCWTYGIDDLGMQPMEIGDSQRAEDQTYVWRRTCATALACLAAFFGYFAVAAARLPAVHGAASPFVTWFAVIGLLFAGSAAASWLGRWWWMVILVVAALVVFIAAMPER